MARIPHFHGRGVGANLRGTKILHAAWLRKRKIGRKMGRKRRKKKGGREGEGEKEGVKIGQREERELFPPCGPTSHLS